MDESGFNTGPIDEQAAYWVRMLKDHPTPKCHAALMQWLKVSPIHSREFALALEVEDRLQRFHDNRHIDVEALIERSRQQQRHGRRRAWTIGIAASIAMLGVAIASGIMLLHDAPETFVTAESQQLIHLEDGSVVALNRRSQLRVVLSAEARNLYLEKGQGIFRVRHDSARPFRVHAGSAVVEAVGTQFDVRVAHDQTTVAVIEGVVQLKPGLSPTRSVERVLPAVELPTVTAGQSAIVRNDGGSNGVTKIDTATVTAWRRSAEQLEFKNRRLVEIASEFNRHNAAPKVRIEGDELRDRRFILVFKNASPTSLLNYLGQDATLEIVHEGDDVIVRERNH